jgi:methylenetetrahydrofolate reductase (NADPH)
VNLPLERPGELADALRTGRFAVTAEIAPPRGADVTGLRETARLLRGWVDAANVTDNQGARVRMSSLAASVVLLAEGLAPVMQMTCRDRNRIALAADALGAAAVGVGAVLPLGGDPLPEGAPGVAMADLDAAGLVHLLTDLAAGILPDGSRIEGPPPKLLVGAAASPGFTPPASLAGKVAAGAAFVQTQVVLDPDRFEEWVAGLRAASALGDAALLPSVVVPASARSVELVAGFGAQVAAGVAERAAAGEGEAVAREVVARLVRIPEVRGAHVLAIGSDAAAAARLAGYAREIGGRGERA